MAWSKEAIEAARKAVDTLDHRQAKSMDELTYMIATAALTAASAVNGDYNAGVEAAKEVVKFFLGDLVYTPRVLDELEKLKR